MHVGFWLKHVKKEKIAHIFVKTNNKTLSLSLSVYTNKKLSGMIYHSKVVIFGWHNNWRFCVCVWPFVFWSFEIRVIFVVTLYVKTKIKL